MWNVWKWNTSVLVVHVVTVLLMFSSALHLSFPGVLSVLVLATGVTAFVAVFVATSVFSATVITAGMAIAAVSSVIVSGVSPLAVLCVLFATLFAYLSAFAARKDGATEPAWAITIAAFPLGIGTVVGGALYFFKFRQSLTRHPAGRRHDTIFRSDVRGNEGMPPDEP